MDRYGKIKRTKYDKNEIITFDNFAEISLYDKSCNLINKTQINLDDVDKCKNYKWSLTKNKYVMSYIDKKPVYLHRFILKERISDELCIDHIDFNTLNNKKENLRVCTHSQNSMHRKGLCKINTSGIHGIHWDKSRSKWKVEIQANNIVYNLGRYESIDEAIKVRQQAEVSLFKNYKPFFTGEK